MAFEHDPLVTGTAANNDNALDGTVAGAEAPGKRTRTQSMGPSIDRIADRVAATLQRRTQNAPPPDGSHDRNGVADGARAAVGRAATSHGTRRRSAVGQHQPDDPFGLHITHEVAHTQPRGGSHGQHELDASTPDDASEVEADPVMRQADGNGVHEDADGAVATAAESSSTSLPTSIMRKFESSLGADLSSVRVHTGAESATAAQAVGARAYTMGQDIHFAAGQYEPTSAGGEHLLAHEVAHTVQQRGGTPTRQNKLTVSTPFDAAEHEADRAADAMVSGVPAMIGGGGFAGAQRQPAPAGDQKPADNKLSAGDQARLQNTLQKTANKYGYLLDGQRDGLEALSKALEAPDPPSFTEQALSFLIQAALGAAFGALGGAIGAVVGKYAGAAAKPLAASVAGAVLNPKDAYVPPGVTASELSGAADVAAKIASSVSKKVEDSIKGAFGTLATKAAATVKGQGPIAQFVSGQKKAARDAAKLASEAFIDNQQQFTPTPEGLAAAIGIEQALEEVYQKASSEQFMASLVEWSKVVNSSNGRENGMIVIECTIDSPQAAPGGFKSTWQGINQAARTIVKQSYSDKVVAETGAMMQIKIKSKDTWIFITSRGRGDVTHPTSGDQAAFLIQKAGGDPKKPDDNLARVGAYLLVNEIAGKRFAEINLATD